MQSVHGLAAVLIGGIVLSSAIYLVLNNAKGVSSVAGGVARTTRTLGNIARGQ